MSKSNGMVTEKSKEKRENREKKKTTQNGNAENIFDADFAHRALFQKCELESRTKKNERKKLILFLSS